MHRLILLIHLITLASSQSASSSSQSSSSSSSSDPPVSELTGLALFEKLKKDFPKLCPKQSDGSPNPKESCTQLTTQLSEMRDGLITQSLTAAAAGISDLSNPPSSRGSSSSGTSSSSSSKSGEPPRAPPPSSNSASQGEAEEGRGCLNNAFESILNKLKDLKTKLQGFDFKEHYFVLFIFTSVIMILLLISQTYHCCLGHLKDRRIRLSNREAQRASNLYHNLQRIHQGRPLLQVNSQNQGTGP